MVQMKVDRDNDWRDRDKKLYIPHGSDESFEEVTKVAQAQTLYPTWFR